MKCNFTLDKQVKFKKMKTIEIKWSTEDVLGKADEMDIKLTEIEADKILDQLYRLHDADLGINWLVIENYIQQHIDDKKASQNTNKHWESYGVYAIALQLKNPEWAIDVQWQEAIDLYEKFNSSEWNDVNQSELECINKFMANLNKN
jgi:hypothetical protein